MCKVEHLKAEAGYLVPVVTRRALVSTEKDQ